MSALLTGKAMRTKVGNRLAKQVLEHLCNYADENDRAWPSVDTLADECESEPRSIIRALRYLEDKHLLAKDHDYGTRYANDRSPYVYQITLDQAEPIVYTHRRAKAKQQERENKETMRGDTNTTPQDDHTTTPRGDRNTTPRGDRNTTRGVTQTPPRGVTEMSPRGDRNTTQTYIEQSLEHSRESTRAQKPKPKTERSFDQRKQALDDYRPTPDLTALAEAWGLDPEWELGKFRDTCLAEGKIPHDPASAYRKWLKRGRELNIGKPAPPAITEADASGSELERRARKLLATSTPLRQRQPDDHERLRWLPQVASLLAQGTSPAHVVDLVCEAFDRGELDEAA